MNNLDIKHFEKKHEFLVCIDSDGTAIDAMNAKHHHCHGPAFIQTWELQAHKDDIQRKWNDINLLKATRGVNRYIALVDMLYFVNEQYQRVDGIDVLKAWVETTPNLSNKGLEEEIQKNPHPLLKKALVWSHEINKRIAKLSYEDKPPFDGVKETLNFMKDKVDIAVISSSNMSAIKEEWTNHGLIEYLDVMTSQKIGTKGECLQQMIQKGYDPKHVLMIGDAYPDVDAANENDTFFYPILTNKETYSWEQLRNKYFNVFVENKYHEYQQAILKEFKENFGNEDK